ncbi:hypothetical protein AYO41_02745 [Verrucomicrobia bacterium SCGC AG-212-E04]|nr:hypothetical protein AYO41_02745 [Verrucomicrobia bacterium SCGC AG-212-E04]
MPLVIPPGPFAAYLFDCDGTLADTMPLHYRAWRATLDPLGVDFPEEQLYQLGGTPTQRIVEILSEQHGLNLSAAEVARQKSEAFVALLDEARPVDEVMRIALGATSDGKKIALVTGSARWVVERILDAIGARDLFSTVIASEDVSHGKPAPDCYLEAARRLAIPAVECLVFEDTRTGIEAATAAGMQSVFVPRSGTSSSNEPAS